MTKNAVNMQRDCRIAKVGVREVGREGGFCVPTFYHASLYEYNYPQNTVIPTRIVRAC